MSKSLEGKVAVITGGGQGVGLGIAKEFVEQGASVVVTGRRQATLDEAVALLGPKSSGIVADVSKLSEMEAMFKEVMARHGRLDTVVADAITNANGPSARLRKSSGIIPSIQTRRASCSQFSRLCR